MIYRRLEQGTRNEIDIIYSIPPSNWQSNRKNQSRIWSVFAALSTKQLDRIVISSGVLV